MHRTAPSHEELRVAAGLRRRDPAAVRALCTDYGPSALALLRRRLGDRTAVEDVYQQVLLEAWERCPTYDPSRSSLRTWLATIARSRAIDHQRRRVPEPADPAAAAARSREPSVDVVEQIALEQLLRKLPEAEEHVLRLHFHVGLSQRQIAAATGTPLGTVKSRTASALRRLRGMLEEERTPPL